MYGQIQIEMLCTYLGLQCPQSEVSPGLLSGALQDRHESRTLANFMIPPDPLEGVDTVMLRVWSPASAHAKLCQWYIGIAIRLQAL